MDNLFVVITLYKNSSKSNVVINSQLSKFFISNTPTISYELSKHNHFTYLIKYSNKSFNVNARDPLKEQRQDQKLKMPIVGNVRIDNKIDLATLCEDEPINESLFSSISEQLLFSLYQKIGAKCFSKVKGNFQTVFWNEKSQTLCAAIDPFSSRSLFYLKVDDVLYISSDVKTLTKVTKINLTLNKTAASQWLSGRPDPNASMFNEISRLPAGHYLEYNAQSGIKVTKFWDVNPDFSIKYNNTEMYKTHFFELLHSSVKNRLAVEQRTNETSVFCQMSGGMDSTSVTAIAKQVLDEKSLLLHTLSHRYKNTRSCDESNNINDMVSRLSLKHQHYIDLDKFEASSFAELYPTDFDNPGIVLSPKYHQELALMKEFGASVLLTGNGGDETCWGHSTSYRSRLFKGELGVIGEVINTCHELNEPVARSLYKLFMPNSIQNLIKLARHKPINAQDCPPWLTEHAIEMIKYEKQLFTNPFSAGSNPAKHARYQGMNTTSTYNSMRSYQKVASNYGVDVRHPFFDTDIVEFSFAIPEKLLIQGVYPKWLLRQTMQNHLPHSVCWNKHKVVFDHHFANLVRSNKDELRKLLSHEGLHDLGLLDNNILLKEFDAVVDNPNGYLNVDMLYAILTQLWFQTHVVDY